MPNRLAGPRGKPGHSSNILFSLQQMRVSDDDQPFAKQQRGIKTFPTQAIATLANGTVDRLCCEIDRPRSGGKHQARIGMCRLKPPKARH